MFQSFEVTADPSQGVARVARLRETLERAGLDGYLVPRADEHQGEYVAACSERLAWLTGFTGSAGVALILRDKALLFVDGRYTLQASEQADPGTFTIESLVDNPPRDWMVSNLAAGARIGFDPWLHTVGEVRGLEKALAKIDGQLVPSDGNLVDDIWNERPTAPLGQARIQPKELAGELASQKLERLAEAVRQGGADFTVLTDPSSLAWAFNIRGSDVPHTPLALGFAIVPESGRPLLFLDKRKLDRETEAYLTQLAELMPPSMLDDEVKRLTGNGKRIGLDPVLAADKLRLIAEGEGMETVDLADPARLPRAIKNMTELAGARAAHRRDGAAMARFLSWLDTQAPGTLTEIAVAEKLEACRATTGEETQMPLRDISFDTISGAGPNGAIIHYRVTTRTNRTLGKNELYLVDSGAQYEDGTTDITRTVIIGAPDAEMRDRFTRVLKGMIAISRLRFPQGTRGADIDAFARHALWQAGLDYAHGTGHGVGSYLSVHEGPQRIAKTGMQKLEAGMILSNEPGYYKPGAYGIRLENLIVVEPATPVAGGEIPMHGFETLTLAPLDRRLVDKALLDEGERAWLDAYHARVLSEIGPMVEEDVRAWLEEATAPLS
ncbi:peptidase M24 [Nitratireductor indicus C115]|uniref:Peptidase M24 n=1 Tax=Nitratireductor indicus C115 TaxID=1231190 RepID=K2NVL5_9HYPH|nr:aminopeptidase P family protein [Nitratireductor indicus]EKF43380.1 peptidase M24 [Nitratireductor indicus C115]SFQ08747.1 Xaa-Pro aminopeptidase [Nitratireductor indicus]